MSVASFGIDIGWCGFGYEGGLLPNIRLGIIRLWCCRGTIVGRFEKMQMALADALKELKR